MPDAENDILSFNNYKFQLKTPFGIYANFECFLPKNSRLLPRSQYVLFDLILYVQSTIFQLKRDGSPWVEPVLS